MEDSICGETEPCRGGKQDSVSIKLTAFFYRRLGLIGLNKNFRSVIERMLWRELTQTEGEKDSQIHCVKVTIDRLKSDSRALEIR